MNSHLENLCASSHDRLFHTMDAIIATVTTVTAAVTAHLVSAEAATGEVSELRGLLIPLIGALIMSGGAIMLNPSNETRRIVIGRAILGLLFGAAGPSAVCAFLPSASMLVNFPAVLLLSGAIISGVFYVMSKPFFSRFYERADFLAKREVSRIEKLPGGIEGK